MIHTKFVDRSKCFFHMLLCLFLANLLLPAAHADDDEISSPSLLRKAMGPNNVDVTFALTGIPLGFPNDISIDLDRLETRLNSALSAQTNSTVVNEPVVVLDLSKDNYSRVKKACDYLGSSKLSLDIKADRVRVLYAPDPEFTASDEFVRVLEGLAILHYRRGQYVLAERNLLQAQQLTPQDTNALDVADIDDALGWVYRQEGMPAKAKECCRESLSIRKKQLPAGHPDVAQSYLNLANLYYELQDPVKGKKYEAKAIPSLKKYKAGFNLEEIQRIPDEILDSKRSDKSALSAAVKNMHALLQRLCVPTTTKVIAASTKDLQAGKDAQKERSHG